MSNFFKIFNLEIFDFKTVKAQGGSIRIYVSHIGSKKINKKKSGLEFKNV